MKHLLLFFIAVSLSAQEFSDDPARPSIGKTGQIFTLRFTPGSKLLEVSLVEKPLVTLDPERLVVFGKAYPLKGQSKTLRIRVASGNLEVVDPVDAGTTLEFRVKDKVTESTETIVVKPGSKP